MWGDYMTYVKITDKNGVPIDDDNRLPVSIDGGGGGGGSMNVNIASDSAGLATAAGQQDIVDAIQALGGGDASSAIYSGTANVTTTAAALTAQAIGEVIIQNDADSTNDVFIGNNTAQDWRLKPGEWVSVKVSNLNLIYAKTSTGTATLRYFARSAAGIGGGGGSPVPVQLTGGKVEVTTIINAQSVAPGGSTGNVSMGLDGTEVEAWVNITIDKQPWTLHGSSNIYVNTDGGTRSAKTFYPSYENHTSTYSSAVSGARALYLGMSTSNSGVNDPTNMQEAKAIAIPPVSGRNLRIVNGSAENATITVRVLRVKR